MEQQHRSSFVVRRIGANAIDFAAGSLVAVILSETVVGVFFATRAVVMLRIGAADTVWKGPLPMIMGILGPFAYGLPFAILFVLLAEALIGTSLGKKLLGIIITTDGNGTPSRGQRWRRAIIKSAPFWGLTLALLTGSWVMAVSYLFVGVVLLADVALAMATSTRAMHERWSGTFLSRR